jgi:hypothetical protein
MYMWKFPIVSIVSCLRDVAVMGIRLVRRVLWRECGFMDGFLDRG